MSSPESKKNREKPLKTKNFSHFSGIFFFFVVFKEKNSSKPPFKRLFGVFPLKHPRYRIQAPEPARLWR